ncbi:MAG: hypothetical protein ABIT58_06230 [Ferruginibacter sp.]
MGRIKGHTNYIAAKFQVISGLEGVPIGKLYNLVFAKFIGPYEVKNYIVKNSAKRKRAGRVIKPIPKKFKHFIFSF